MSSSRKYFKFGTDAIIALAPGLIKEKDLNALLALKEEIGYRERTKKALDPTLKLIEETILSINAEKLNSYDQAHEAFPVDRSKPIKPEREEWEMWLKDRQALSLERHVEFLTGITNFLIRYGNKSLIDSLTWFALSFSSFTLVFLTQFIIPLGHNSETIGRFAGSFWFSDFGLQSPFSGFIIVNYFVLIYFAICLFYGPKLIRERWLLQDFFNYRINQLIRHLVTLFIGIYYICFVFNSIILIIGDDPIIKAIPFNSVGGGLLVFLAIMSLGNLFLFFMPISKTILPDDEVWFKFRKIKKGQ